MAVDITINETIDLVDITVNPNIIEVNVTRTSGGGGGTQTFAQTLALGRNTGGTNPLINNADAIELENGSSLKKGTYDFGGDGGTSRICSVGYEDNWQSGIRHVFDNNGFIRHSTNCFDVVPDSSFDVTLRFKVDSLWTLDDGTTYKCLDASTGAAVWEQVLNFPNLGQVLEQGDRVYKEISGDYTLLPTDNKEWLLYVPSTGTITLDDSTDTFLEHSSIPIKIQCDCVFEAVSTDVRSNLGVDIETPITTANLYRGDNIEFKKLASGIWFLQVDRSPKKTSDLTNDGADGINPFITALDIPPASNGLPTGGTAGQILTKVDATDYNATWQENYADWTSVVKHTVKNDGTALITKGTAVYVTGSNGTNMLVGKASNATEATSSKTMGLMQSNITTTGGTQTGFVITEGLLEGLNTATATAGDPVWLGVNGALIYGLANKPYAPAHLVFIGIVTKVSSGNGEIFVKVQNGFELKEIHDVDLITNAPTNNQLLSFDSATSLWKNKSVTTADIADSLNKRYVTDAQQTVIGNTSGTNSGDNAVNSLYSGLAASKEDTSNKQTDLTASATKFPTVNAVNTGLALKQNTSTLLADTLDTGILRNNYFWFLPSGVTAGGSYGFGYSERISSTAFILLLNGVITRGMLSFNTTATAGTIASMRQNNDLQLQGYECKFTRKIQFNSNVSGQRFFCGISKGNQFAIATNVEPNTLTDIVGVCQLSTSTNMHIVYNDASGTATTSDLGSSYPCNDSQYNYYITIEQTTTSYIITVERVTVATGASISTSVTTSTNIPNYATGVIQLFTFITNNATAAVASYLDGGGIGSFKNQ